MNFPFAPAMAFVEPSKRFLGGQILQTHLRYVEPGLPAEVALKMYPGRVFDAEVDYVIPVAPTGQVPMSGMALPATEVLHTPFWVVVTPGEELAALELPVGATGSVAIYTQTGAPTHVIRKVIIRTEAIMNYINPL